MFRRNLLPASSDFYLEEGISKYFRNTGTYLPDCTESHPTAGRISNLRTMIISGECQPRYTDRYLQETWRHIFFPELITFPVCSKRKYNDCLVHGCCDLELEAGKYRMDSFRRISTSLSCTKKLVSVANTSPSSLHFQYYDELTLRRMCDRI
jgi:hypothetical protein